MHGKTARIRKAEAVEQAKVEGVVKRKMSRRGEKKKWEQQKNLVLCALPSIFLVYVMGTSAVTQYQGLSGMAVLSASKSDQLRQVFYGGNPWVVQCRNDTVAVPEVYSKAASKLRGAGVRTGVLDCDATLESGKTVYERFNLKRNPEPTLYLFANRLKPRRVIRASLGSKDKLVNWVVMKSEPKLPEVTGNKGLAHHCTSKKHCAMVLSTGKLNDNERDIVNSLQKRHRTINFHSIDTTETQLSFEVKSDKPGPKLVLFKKETVGEGDDATDKHSIKVFQEDFSFDLLSDYLEDDKKNSYGYKALVAMPTVGRRAGEDEDEEEEEEAEAADGEEDADGEEAPAKEEKEEEKEDAPEGVDICEKADMEEFGLEAIAVEEIPEDEEDEEELEEEEDDEEDEEEGDEEEEEESEAEVVDFDAEQELL